jgi:hypothetical protein
LNSGAYLVTIIPRDVNHNQGHYRDSSELEFVIDNVDIRKLLDRGTLTATLAGLMRTATRSASFKSSNRNKTVFFDAGWTVDGRWSDDSCSVSEEDIKPSWTRIREAIAAGSASILVSAKTGGDDYITSQTPHWVAAHVWDLGRLVTDDNQQPIASTLRTQETGSALGIGLTINV